MDIGIIGYGVVGRATHNSFKGMHNVRIKDPALHFDHDLSETDAIFICVPTPTKLGLQYTGIIHDVLEDLNKADYQGLIIIKSTTLPIVITEIYKKYPALDIMVAPEFLDQNKPYFEQQKHLIGVKDIFQANIYKAIFNADDEVRTTTPETAMMAKYVHNCYGALKVTFFNEVKDICDKEGIDYREMLGAMLGSTDHISRCYTRMAVDGERGFGGACFGKDIIAMTSAYDVKTLKTAISQNKTYRKEYMEEME